MYGVCDGADSDWPVLIRFLCVIGGLVFIDVLYNVENAIMFMRMMPV